MRVLIFALLLAPLAAAAHPGHGPEASAAAGWMALALIAAVSLIIGKRRV